MTVVYQDERSVYIRIGGTIFRPVKTVDSYLPEEPQPIKVGEHVVAKHVGPSLVKIKYRENKKHCVTYWWSHGIIQLAGVPSTEYWKPILNSKGK